MRSIKKEKQVLNFIKLSKDAKTPEYALENDSGFDLFSNEDVSFFPMEQKKVRTGIALEIPKGYVGIIRDRAGIVQK
jgi:dUTP pyrophosphatase